MATRSIFPVSPSPTIARESSPPADSDACRRDMFSIAKCRCQRAPRDMMAIDAKGGDHVEIKVAKGDLVGTQVDRLLDMRYFIGRAAVLAASRPCALLAERRRLIVATL